MVGQHMNTESLSYTGYNLQVWTTEIASCDYCYPYVSYSTTQALPLNDHTETAARTSQS